MSDNGKQSRSLVKPTLADVGGQMHGQMMLEAFQAIKPGDVQEVVTNLVERAKKSDQAASVLFKLLSSQALAKPQEKARKPAGNARLSPPPGVHPDDRDEEEEEDDDGPAARIARLQRHRKDLPKIKQIIRAIGESCTVAHVREDGFECTDEEFRTIMEVLFPKQKQWWKEPVGAAEKEEESKA